MGEADPQSRGAREYEQHSRKFIVLLQGQSSQKNVDGRPTVVTPSLLIDVPYRNFFLGLELPEAGQFYNALWGQGPDAVHGWRALRFLEQVPTVDNTILFNSWEVMKREGPPGEIDYTISKLSPLFIDAQKVRDLREQFMAQAPSTEQLEEMIRSTQNAGLHVNGWELKREVAAGAIEETPFIRDIILDTQEKNRIALEAYRKRDEEIKIPLDRDESFGELLVQLEMGNIILGTPFGAYGMDWGFTKLEYVDRQLKQDSYYGDHGQSLYRSTKIITFDRTELSPGVTMVTPDAGEIITPEWTDPATGINYTFSKARYKDGHVYLTTEVKQSSGEVEHQEYAVSELRNIIGIPLLSAE